ncbi:MAG: mandelate racemase/muconate lactonizing enzyme family protein [Lachnospiraceae bacterium]|nr:mandelate racemase/muconate lactonizing enzyme family protein [Candidatus Minthocola equi]
MKITDIKTYVVYAYRVNFLFVKVFTDEGITGVGEGTLDTKESALLGAVEDIRPMVIGKNPIDIEKLTHDLYRDTYWRIGAVLQSAISMIEIACWDICGKYYNAPVMNLLGGQFRDEIKLYANGWFAGAKTPEDFAEKAKYAVSKGIKALKWDPFGKSYMHIERQALHNAINCVAAVRDAVGPDVDILIEGHGRFDVPTAIEITKALKPYEPMFFEEPVPPDSLDALAAVHKKAEVPIAAGERLYSIRNFLEFIEKGCADFAQMDVTHCGGIMALKKMAAMAEAAYIEFAPHNPSGPVANAASLQLAGNLPNYRILEIMYTDVNWRGELSDEEVVFNDGCIRIPKKPGLGVELCEENFAKYPFMPVYFKHYNGNLTDVRPKEATSCYFKQYEE